MNFFSNPQFFILSVLTFGGYPKIISFILTLFSFPIFLNSLGLNLYGNYLIYVSIFIITEIFVDFGISSASAKEISKTRSKEKKNIFNEFVSWTFLQLIFLIIGIFPMFFFCYLILNYYLRIDIQYDIFFCIGASIYLRTIINYIKSHLLILLEFKNLSFIDLFDSISRSISYLLVGFYFSNLLSFVILQLLISILMLLFSFYLLWIFFRKNKIINFILINKINFNLIKKLKLSMNFLWLRVATRFFYEIPIIFSAKISGFDFTGFIGSLRRIIDILSTPYLVIGNGYMSRIIEIKSFYKKEMNRLYNSILRISSTSVILYFMLLINIDLIQSFFFKDILISKTYIILVLSMIISTILISTITPLTDYLGGLFSRNVFLSLLSSIYLIILTSYIQKINLELFIIIYLFFNFILCIGYLIISIKFILNINPINFDLNIIIFILINLISYLTVGFFELKGLLLMNILYLLIVFFILLFLPSLRVNYLYIKNFLYFPSIKDEIEK